MLFKFSHKRLLRRTNFSAYYIERGFIKEMLMEVIGRKQYARFYGKKDFHGKID